jgi:poly(A)-specific ribonuclease
VWDELNQKYVINTFNFYVLNNSKVFDGVFSVRADCLYFLSKNGFDFSKLHLEGMTFQRLSEKDSVLEAIRNKTEQDWANYKKRDQACLSKSNQKILSTILDMTKELAEGGVTSKSIDLSEFYQGEEEVSNALKQEILNQVTTLYPGINVEYTKTKSTIKIKKGKKYTAQTEVKLEEEKDEDLESVIQTEFLKEMGFSLVIEELIKAKKPIVGHNLIYDMGFIYDQFIAPLPQTFLEFSEKWRECFPVTYDTKTIALLSNLKLFRRTDLESLYKV